MSEVEIYVSAGRSTSTTTPLEGTVQGIKVISETGTVPCYVELKIPGGVTIPKLSLTYNGDRLQDLLLYDSKDNSIWTTPMKITELVISIADSYPNVIFQNEHDIITLTVSGNFCVCNFNKLKIGSMNFAVTLGSLSVVQNSAYSTNRVLVKTPKGTHCVAGASISTTDSSQCPNTATRDAGISGTFIDTSSYCQSDMYVCSNTAGACPTSGTAITTGQGNFDITLNDGPVQFLIDGSTTVSSSSYYPTFDTFSISSQLQLTENNQDFSTEPEDPRIYLYEVISPGYAKMWVHSSLKQYIQARPWLLSMLSLNTLRPTYYRFTLIHIPGGSCPYAHVDNVKSNTLISEKIKELSYTQSGHLVARKTSDTYHHFHLTSENDYVKETISFLDNNVLITICLIVSLAVALSMLFLFWSIIFKFKRNFEEFYLVS